ncbi:hypothetical protein [Streptomyces sp. WAC07061]|uniref:hypothetical protein n=1 Tax=Streptomyces sp. WAC07061 TaxID=2487410 RepID=UPI0021AEC89A|nr:hypothetical protein [Streptomyces sp. WAC07061]
MGRHRLHAAPRRGAKRTAVRTGLLGASVAVALGTAAVTTGFVPVGGSFPYVGTGAGEKTQARAEPSAAASPEPAGQPNGLANLSGRASAAAPQPHQGPLNRLVARPGPRGEMISRKQG